MVNNIGTALRVDATLNFFFAFDTFKGLALKGQPEIGMRPAPNNKPATPAFVSSASPRYPDTGSDLRKDKNVRAKTAKLIRGRLVL